MSQFFHFKSEDDFNTTVHRVTDGHGEGNLTCCFQKLIEINAS